MFEYEKSRFPELAGFAALLPQDGVYPCSILETPECGRLFADANASPAAALFWHRCGFAYLLGDPNEAFVADVLTCLNERFEPRQRRFRLHVYTKELAERFSGCGLACWTQELFSLPENGFTPKLEPPAGFSVKEAGLAEINGFSGRITPAFSWPGTELFLSRGKAFCVKHENAAGQAEVVSMAFTAAIGGGGMDIGVETAAGFRGLGLGRLAASHTVRYALAQGYSPVWRCAAANNGSAAIARSMGFKKASEHPVYMKQPEA